MSKSGDEMAFRLDGNISSNDVRSLLVTLGEEGVFGHYRPVLIIPTETPPNGSHVVSGEAIEKNLRWKLFGSNRFRPSEWENLMIGVEVRPNAQGGSVVGDLGRCHLLVDRELLFCALLALSSSGNQCQQPDPPLGLEATDGSWA